MQPHFKKTSEEAASPDSDFCFYNLIFVLLQVCSVLDSLEREYKREDDWLAR